MQLNNDIISYHSHELKGLLIRGSNLEKWLNQGNSPRQFGSSDAEIIKSNEKITSSIETLQLPSILENENRLFVKKFSHKPYWRILYSLIGRHRAVKTWEMSRVLSEIGIPVPKTFGYFICPRGNDWGTSYCCTEVIRDTENLTDMLTNNKGAYNRLCESGIFTQVVSGIAKMHDHHITHGDLKWVNIMVSISKALIWFIDLDSCTRQRLNIKREISKDLARFVVSGFESGLNRNEVYPLLTTYAELRNMDIAHVNRMIRDPIRKLSSQKKIKINL